MTVQGAQKSLIGPWTPTVLQLLQMGFMYLASLLSLTWGLAGIGVEGVNKLATTAAVSAFPMAVIHPQASELVFISLNRALSWKLLWHSFAGGWLAWLCVWLAGKGPMASLIDHVGLMTSPILWVGVPCLQTASMLLTSHLSGRQWHMRRSVFEISSVLCSLTYVALLGACGYHHNGLLWEIGYVSALPAVLCSWLCFRSQLSGPGRDIPTERLGRNSGLIRLSLALEGLYLPILNTLMRRHDVIALSQVRVGGQYVGAISKTVVLCMGSSLSSTHMKWIRIVSSCIMATALYGLVVGSGLATVGIPVSLLMLIVVPFFIQRALISEHRMRIIQGGKVALLGEFSLLAIVPLVLAAIMSQMVPVDERLVWAAGIGVILTYGMSKFIGGKMEK